MCILSQVWYPLPPHQDIYHQWEKKDYEYYLNTLTYVLLVHVHVAELSHSQDLRYIYGRLSFQYLMF